MRKNYTTLSSERNEQEIKQFLSILAQELATIPNKSLNLTITYQNIRLNSLCVQSLNDAMSSVNFIVDLTLSYCSLADDAINSISEMLKERKALRKVSSLVRLL